MGVNSISPARLHVRPTVAIGWSLTGRRCVRIREGVCARVGGRGCKGRGVRKRCAEAMRRLAEFFDRQRGGNDDAVERDTEETCIKDRIQ